MSKGLRPRPENVDESRGALLGTLGLGLVGCSMGTSIFGLKEKSDEIIWFDRGGGGCGFNCDCDFVGRA